MRNVTSILLILLMLIQLFSRTGVYLCWKMNQDYLTKHVCVNRNNPKSCCQAKCQLTKRLTTLDNSESQNEKQDSSKSKFADWDPFILSDFEICYTSIEMATPNVLHKPYSGFFQHTYLQSSFQPPDSIA